MSDLITVRKNIFFDREKHRYFERLPGGERTIPSVSQVLKATGQLDKMRFIHPRYAQRGTDVHYAIAQDLRGKLDRWEVKPEILPYLKAFWAFMHEYKPEMVDCEVAMYDPIHDVCGTADAIFRFPKSKTPRREDLVDWKSGAFDDSHRLQLAGYDIMKWGKNWLKHGMGPVYLDKFGRHNYMPYPVQYQMAAGAEWVRLVQRFSDNRFELFKGES